MPTSQQLPALTSYRSASTRLDTPVPGYAATIWTGSEENGQEHFFLAVPSAEGGQQIQIPATEAGLKKLVQILRARQMPRARGRGRGRGEAPTGLNLWKQQREHHKKEHGKIAVNSCLFCKGEARDRKMQARACQAPAPKAQPKVKKLGTGPDAVIVRRITPPGKNYSQQYSMEDLGL